MNNQVLILKKYSNKKIGIDGELCFNPNDSTLMMYNTIQNEWKRFYPKNLDEYKIQNSSKFPNFSFEKSLHDFSNISIIPNIPSIPSAPYHNDESESENFEFTHSLYPILEPPPYESIYETEDDGKFLNVRIQDEPLDKNIQRDIILLNNKAKKNKRKLRFIKNPYLKKITPFLMNAFSTKQDNDDIIIQKSIS